MFRHLIKENKLRKTLRRRGINNMYFEFIEALIDSSVDVPAAMVLQYL